MAKFITSFEVILANEKEIVIYYETASNNINALLKKYNIRDPEGKFEEVSSVTFKVLLSSSAFFQSTPLKSIFFNQKQ